MEDDVKMTAITVAKSPPNWREAFEQVLAAGGKGAGFEECGFCRILHVTTCGSRACKKCPFATSLEPDHAGYCVPIFGPDNMDNSERRAICRHVLATVKDFTDVTEIRERIAEMLDDPEKFLGKAEEPKPKYGYYYSRKEPYRKKVVCVHSDTAPALHHFVSIRPGGGRDDIIAAFLNEDMARKIAELLSA